MRKLLMELLSRYPTVQDNNALGNKVIIRGFVTIMIVASKEMRL